MTTLFLAQRGLCTRQYMAPEELAAAHWDNVIYRHTARHWHARWARWTAPGEPTERFAAERIFTPREPATDAPSSETCAWRAPRYPAVSPRRSDALTCPWGFA